MHKLITMVFFWNLWWLGIGAAIGQPAPLQAPAPDSAQMVPIVEVGGFMPGIGGLKQIVDLPVVVYRQVAQGHQVRSESRTEFLCCLEAPQKALDGKSAQNTEQTTDQGEGPAGQARQKIKCLIQAIVLGFLLGIAPTLMVIFFNNREERQEDIKQYSSTA